MEKKTIFQTEKLKVIEDPGNPAPKPEDCCGGTPINNQDACCKLDEDKKAAGEPGCGCGTPPSTNNKKSCC